MPMKEFAHAMVWCMTPGREPGKINRSSRLEG